MPAPESPAIVPGGYGSAFSRLRSLGRTAMVQDCRAKPETHLQREFHVVAVLAHCAAKALLGLTDPVLDGVLVQYEAFGGGLVAAPGLQEYQQGLTQAGVLLVIGGQARERAAHPPAQQIRGPEHHRDGRHLGKGERLG